MDKLLVSTGGVLGIAITYWFFMMKTEHKVEAEGKVSITVEGGYSPNVIALKKGVKTTLIFTRKDPNPCLEEMVIPDFKIKRLLPLGKSVSVILEPHQIGTYQLSCGMHMFHGKILVHE
jgi:plastocyanin domain-containing protein